MKKLSLLFAALMISVISIWAQPHLLNYQGVARNTAGAPLASQAISLRISILDGSATGPVLYSETHTTTTNAYGLYTIAIGGGTVVSGTMAGINWGAGDRFAKVEIDPAGGSAYVDLGAKQLLSVPYAQQASTLNIFQTGTSNPDKMVIAHSPSYQNYGLMYSDPNDLWHIVSNGNKNITIDPQTPKMGIGKNLINPMAGSLHTEGDRGAYRANVRVVQRTTNSGYAGLSLLSYDGPSPNGAVLYGKSYGGGINVADTASGYVAITASAFNVSSDRRLKKEINPVTSAQYDAYLQQIRAIESATYFYNNETREMRAVPHIGFIAQSLPAAVQTEIDLHPDGSSTEKRIGYNLSDFAGLSLVGIKAIDHKQQALEAKVKSLEERIAQLEKLLQQQK